MLQQFLFISLIFVSSVSFTAEARWPEKTHYRYQEVNGHSMFYREAGTRVAGKPTMVLLHGWPSSSHYFRELIPLLSGHMHVIAPDNLGSGYSAKPDATESPYSFELLAKQLNGLLDALDIDKAIYYVQDFGAPVGFRAMVHQPKRVKGIVAQNGNAYIEGLGNGVADFFEAQAAAASPDFAETMQPLAESVVVGSYVDNVHGDKTHQSPDAYTHDWLFLDEQSEQLIQAQLLQDYVNNIADYPHWQKTFRIHQPKVLAVWGENDGFFISAGGKAFAKDLKDTTYVGLDAGHFAIEEQAVEIAKHMITFFNRF